MEEYQILCNAWVEVSQDHIYGINQKKDKLWEGIYEVFYHNKSNNGRTSKSLSCCMSCIMKAINKFRGYVR